MIKGVCHLTRARHIVCNFMLGMVFGLMSFIYDDDISIILSFIGGCLYMVYEYKVYNELNKINLLSIQFGSIFTIFSIGLIRKFIL